MQPQLERVLGDAGRVSGLAGREPFDVPHQQHRAIGLRQLGDGRANQRARLLLLERTLARLRPRDHGLRVMAVLGKDRQQRLDRLLGAALPAANAHQRRVDDDAVQPGGELGLAVEALDGAEGGEKGVLHHVARGFLVRDEPSRHGQHPAAERPDHFFEGVLVARLEALDERGVGRDWRNRWSSGCREDVTAVLLVAGCQAASDVDQLLRGVDAVGDASGASNDPHSLTFHEIRQLVAGRAHSASGAQGSS